MNSFDFEIEEREEFFVRQLSHTGGDIIFDVYHSASRNKIMYIKQSKNYVDTSKVVHDTTHKRLLKMRRDQGLPIMPMYLHDYRHNREYKWKGREVYNKDDKKVGHYVVINPDHERLTFDIVNHKDNRTVAWVSAVEKTELGVCSYKISANPNADIPFIVTLVISVDERYMGMAKLKDSSAQAALCTIQ